MQKKNIYGYTTEEALIIIYNYIHNFIYIIIYITPYKWPVEEKSSKKEIYIIKNKKKKKKKKKTYFIFISCHVMMKLFLWMGNGIFTHLLLIKLNFVEYKMVTLYLK